MTDSADEPTHIRKREPEEPTFIRPQTDSESSDADRDTTGVARADKPVASSKDSAEDPFIGQRLLNRYLMVKKIGGGGFGSVYKAVDELKKGGGERNEIAIKTLDLDVSSDRLSGLIQEVSRSHTVSHPNILRVYDIHLDNDLAFITMVLLVGESLEERLEKGKLDETEVDIIAERMCAALGHCHDENLIHSDIKPGNIFLCADGDTKLLDLGIAQMMGSANQIAGYSPMYASPEQIAVKPPDPRDDLFSLCCVLYESLTGEHPFERRDAVKARSMGIEPHISELPRRYRRALGDGLAFEREQRPATAQKLWSRISPAVRKRYLIVAGLAVVAAIGFVASNQIGEQIGKAAISVSPEDQAYALTRYEQAVQWLETSEGDAREALVEALQRNPYLEEAAELLVSQVRMASPAKPSQFSLAWTDFAAALVASPTSEALNDFLMEATDEILSRDTSDMSRIAVLSEMRGPVCALSTGGYRSEDLALKGSELSISC